MLYYFVLSVGVYLGHAFDVPQHLLQKPMFVAVVLKVRPVISSKFFLVLGLFTNLPLPQNFLERREVATQGKKEVACIASKPVVFYL